MDETMNDNTIKYTNNTTGSNYNDMEQQHFVRLDENFQHHSSQEQSTISQPQSALTSSLQVQVPTTTTTTTTTTTATQNDNHQQYRIQREGRDYDNNNNNEITIDYKNISRIIITGIAVLLIIAGVLTVISVSHYKLLIGIFWIILISLYCGLIIIIQSAAQTGHRPFHPIVHTVADWISTECTNFITDCHNINEIVLLLKNNDNDTTSVTTTNIDPISTSELVQYDQSNTDFVPVTDVTDTHTVQQQQQQQQKQPRKAKSILFRTLVQPFLGFHIKRRNKNRNRQ